MNTRSVRLRDFDPVLMLAALALVGIGGLLIYSASLTQFGSPSLSDFAHPVMRQAAFAIVGLILALGIARANYRVLGVLSVGMYVAAIAVLAFVVVAGEATYGSRRWIEVAGTPVQPSEIAKLVVIIALAKYLSDHQDSIGDLKVFLTSLAMAAVPTLLVFAEPDLGSAVIFAVIWLGMVLAAGAKWRHVAGLAGVALASVPFALIGLINDYQRDRIALWLDPESDPLGAGFQSLQAQIGIGSGGLFGKGLTEGGQTQLDYLRTETTDYVFSVLGEELGLVGALVLFSLFIVLLWRALRVAELSRDLFGRLLATGMVIFILLQTFINIAVNVGLLPVTGIPLPFVSQGGSSLLTLFICLGILQSILMRRRTFTVSNYYDT
ncbi:MAG: rod shape-determining protein RodA [Chloroflexi bacterium]|nr:rod shape-determining protein RodA [Chloroflexota bacterium]MCI0855414.1 rod shape-determining protein RodA [Chloroflexota bacterium]MCI0889495.1 rod shape-determining protein RodA [Chloroflexota bacterium]